MFVLFVGPENNPITGQSLAFGILADKIKFNKKIIYYPTFTGDVYKYIYKTLCFFVVFLYYIFLNFNDNSCVYITTSRTRFGFIRDFFVIIFSKALKYKIVNHLHGADFVRFRQSLSIIPRFFLDFTYELINVSIVLSPSMKEQYSCYPKMKIEVISNFSSYFYDNPNRFLSDGTLKILFVSNLIYSKGIFHLIDAFNRLDKTQFDLELHIAGIPMGDEYMSAKDVEEKFNNALATESRIHYMGLVSGEVKFDLFKSCHLFCLPSFYKTEAQPISIIEAMSCGCAVLTTKHNYLSELVDPQGALIVSPNDVDEIVKALEQSCNKMRLFEMGRKNIDFVRKKHTLTAHLSAVSKVIERELYGS